MTNWLIFQRVYLNNLIIEKVLNLDLWTVQLFWFHWKPIDFKTKKAIYLTSNAFRDQFEKSFQDKCFIETVQFWDISNMIVLGYNRSLLERVGLLIPPEKSKSISHWLIRIGWFLWIELMAQPIALFCINHISEFFRLFFAFYMFILLIGVGIEAIIFIWSNRSFNKIIARLQMIADRRELKIQIKMK